MIALLGKSLSGKDYILDKLIKEKGFTKIVAYTTRPKRTGELDGYTYHYISKEDFLVKIKNGFFAEWASYNTEDGIWYYGTAKEDYLKEIQRLIVILTPQGYQEVKKTIPDIKSIYLYSNSSTLKERSSDRNGNIKEKHRRTVSDYKDFKNVENIVHKIVYNNIGTHAEDLIKIINFWYDQWHKEEK